MSTESYRPSKRYISNDVGYLLVEHFFIFLVATVSIFFIPWTILKLVGPPIPKEGAESAANMLQSIMVNPGPFVAFSVLLGSLFTMFFILKKVRKKEIMYVNFDDSAKELIIGLKKYFDKDTSNQTIPYKDLKFSHEVKKASGERGYKFKIEFYNQSRLVSILNSSKGIWQLHKDQKLLGDMINRLKRISGS